MPTIDVVQGLRFRVEGYIGPGCFFFFCGPFLLVPRVIGFWKIFCCRPRVCKVFFFCCAPLGAANFRRGQSKKKNTTQGVFFFAPAPGKGRGRRSPVPARGQSKKKNTTQGVFFFAPAPGKGKGRRSPVGRRHGARAKKKNTTQGVFFFCSSPGERQGKEKPRWAPARWCCFFCSGPVSAPNGASPSLAFRRGRSKKNNSLGGVFFFCSGPVPARGFSFPCLSPGPEQKKNTLGGVFFLLRPRADAHSLTAGLGGDASPSPGWCFSFAAAPPGPGWCFFFLLWPRPDAHSLTVGWGDFGKARVVFFFCCGPAGSF